MQNKIQFASNFQQYKTSSVIISLSVRNQVLCNSVGFTFKLKQHNVWQNVPMSIRIWTEYELRQRPTFTPSEYDQRSNVQSSKLIIDCVIWSERVLFWLSTAYELIFNWKLSVHGVWSYYTTNIINLKSNLLSLVIILNSNFSIFQQKVVTNIFWKAKMSVRRLLKNFNSLFITVIH